MLFFGVWAAVAIAVLYLTREVLLPFFLAVVVAYVLAPLVGLLQKVRIGKRHVPRWVAVVVIYAGLIGALAAFIAVGVPRLMAEVERLADDAPRLVSTVREEWLPQLERQLLDTMAAYEQQEGVRAPVAPDGGTAAAEADAGVEEEPTSLRIVPAADGQGGYEVDIPPGGILVSREGNSYRIRTAADAHQDGGRYDIRASLRDAVRRLTENTQETTATILRTAQTVIRSVVKGIFTFFIMLMLSAYLLVTSDRIFGFARSLVRSRRRKQFDSLLRRIDKGLSGVVRGQLLIALVNGVLSAIGFYIADLNYWPILALIATLLSIIPIFGAIISSVPAVIVGLQNGIGTALFVLLWIVAIHQLEANVLNPKIMGDQAKVHPVLIVFALLAGEHVAGIAGALLAVPILSIVQSLFLHFRDQALGVPGPRPSVPPGPGGTVPPPTIPPPPRAPDDSEG